MERRMGAFIRMDEHRGRQKVADELRPLRAAFARVISPSSINQTHAEAEWRASGRAGILPAVPGILPGTPDAGRPPFRRHAQPMADVPGRIPGAAGERDLPFDRAAPTPTLAALA